MDIGTQALLAVVLVLIVFILFMLMAKWLIAEPNNNKPLRKDWDHEPEPDLRDLEDLLRPVCEPALLLRKTARQTGSHFGGYPPAFPGFAWPRWKGTPLSFLARIDLGKISGNLPWLPNTGTLLFFYDMDEMPSGCDLENSGGWAVLYLENGALITGDAAEPEDMAYSREILHSFLEPIPTLLPPSPGERVLESLQLDEEETDAICEYKASLYGEAPHHQIGGYCEPAQEAGLELECEAAYRGMGFSGAEKTEDLMEASVAECATDWKLLLQVDSDDGLEMMWGDVGKLYFWVREQDSRRGDFSKVCVFLQCS